MVFADALARVSDEAHAFGAQVGKPVKPVEDFAGQGIGVERVNGEIAPRRVFAPVAGKGDLGMAAVGRDVAAERGDLDMPAVQHRGDRAVGKARGNAAYPGFVQPGDHIGRGQGGCRIDIVDGLVQQAVAHRTSNPADVVRAEHLHKLREVLSLHPVGIKSRH